jgi:hypothetical protein
MTPLETLKAARQLISDPAKWTQGEFARDGDGDAVPVLNPRAHCFCALGAIEKTLGNGAWTESNNAISRVCSRKFDQEVGHFNDTHTHPEVLALFDAAIAELEQSR